METTDVPPFAQVRRRARKRQQTGIVWVLASIAACAVVAVAAFQVLGHQGESRRTPDAAPGNTQVTISTIVPSNLDDAAKVDAVANRTTATLTRKFPSDYFGGAVLDNGPRYVFKAAAPPDAIRIIEASGVRSEVAEGLGLNLPEAVQQQSAFSRALTRRHMTCDSMVPLPSDLSWHVSCDEARVDMAEVRRLAAQHLREAPIVFDDSIGDAGPAS